MGAAAPTISQASAVGGGGGGGGGVKEERVTAKGLWHIILRHSQGEGIQW